MYIVLGLESATLSCVGLAVYVLLGLELAVLSFLIPYLPTSALRFQKKMFCVNSTLSDIFHLEPFIH